MYFYNNKNTKELRRKLRKASTSQEDVVWFHLRSKKLGFKFHRQYSIAGYIVDFYCPLKRLVIEIDGNYHIENKEYDKKRTEVFMLLDIRVLRFWNSEVDENIKKVLDVIIQNLNIPHP